MTAPAAAPAALTPVGIGLANLMTAVLDALTANLLSTVGGPVGRAVMAPGDTVPADACCAEAPGAVEGQAHVRLARTFPTTRFPFPDTAWSKVPSNLGVELEVGVYRCVSGLDAEGKPPTAGAVSADAVRAVDDLGALRRTALETFPGAPVALGSSSVLGPSGYCAGTVLSFTIMFNPACPPGIV